MDKVRPNRDLGMVRDGLDDSLEKHFSSHGDQQKVRMVADERQSMGEHSEPLVEVSDRQISDADPFSDQLGVVNNRIKGANLRKISGGGRSRMDTAKYREEEDTSKQADRVFVAGESPQSEIDAVRRTCDQLNNAHQSLLEHDGDYQALGHSAQGATRVEDGTPRSMEVERR